jgi:hypothetical protein
MRQGVVASPGRRVPPVKRPLLQRKPSSELRRSACRPSSLETSRPQRFPPPRAERLRPRWAPQGRDVRIRGARPKQVHERRASVTPAVRGRFCYFSIYYLTIHILSGRTVKDVISALGEFFTNVGAAVSNRWPTRLSRPALSGRAVRAARAVLAAGALGALAFSGVTPVQAQSLPAGTVCQEILPPYCANNQTQTIDGEEVPAPIIPGFSSGCWDWQRTFQCVDPPSYSCSPAADFSTVMSTCSLTAATINSSITLNNLTYITSGTYTYDCGFGTPTQTTSDLPSGDSCVELSSSTSDSNYVNAAPPGTQPATDGTSGAPTTATLSGSIATTQTTTENYVCYAPPQTICSDTCYAQTTDANGTTNETQVPCTAPVTTCTVASDSCNDTLTTNADGSTSTSQALGPDGRCIDSTQYSTCQNGNPPACLNQSNCTLTSSGPSSVQPNGTALTQTQNYTCTNTTTSCGQYATVNNCVEPNAWGWDQIGIDTTAGSGLGAADEAIAQLTATQQGMNNDDPYIFSGQNMTCTYPMGGFLDTFLVAVVSVIAVATAFFTAGGSLAALASMSFTAAETAAMETVAEYAAAATLATAAYEAPNSQAFGTNCCQDYVVQGSDAWYKLGSCSGEEVQLGVARYKGLTYYLGDYCSKHEFPFGNCVQETESYCVFDDLLALIVNEQGREQLAEIQAADSVTTTATNPINFNLYNTLQPNATKYAGVLNNGQWVQLANQNGSQVWYWQFPGYCDSTADQAAAYSVYNTEVDNLMSLQGIQPGTMTTQQAANFLANMTAEPAFQECPTTPGTISFMTCQLQNDECNTSELPANPEGISTDMSGSDVSTADPNWIIQEVPAFQTAGQVQTTATMPSNPSFPAVTTAINDFVSSTGSCQNSGACLYTFEVTNKEATNGLGARKQTSSTVQFPMYTMAYSSALPSITYLSPSGVLNMAAYEADPSRGMANPTTVSTQRFIFHPNQVVGAPPNPIGLGVLLEYAYTNTGGTSIADDYIPLVVPTSLAPDTPGWWPYVAPGADASNPDDYFYLSGSCDPTSYWCNYTITVDLNVPLHPWGSPQDPQCWGFTMEQMAALDFSKMDLSQWVNSLELNLPTSGMTAGETTAMQNQVTASAQAFYSATSTGATITSPGGGDLALVTNTDVLPDLNNPAFQSYYLTFAVPSNWPQYYTTQPNDNPVTNVQVNWGDGSPSQPVSMASGNMAYDGSHDYGDDPAGQYTVTVTLDTANNGSQTLTADITVQPNAGVAASAATVSFNNNGADGAPATTYTPSNTISGNNEDPTNVQTLSPGTTAQFADQGASVGAAASTPTTTLPTGATQ